MKTYAKTKCRTCGERISTNGMARASHAKKHVREGLLVAVESISVMDGSYGSVRYVSPDEAEQLTRPGRKGLLIYRKVAVN